MEKTVDTTKMKLLIQKQQLYIKELERKLRAEQRKSVSLEVTINSLKRRGE